MDFQKAVQEVKKTGVPPVLTLQGSEDYLLSQFRELVAQLIEDKEGELDLTTIDLEEESIDRVLDEAEMYSFFVSQRLIIVEYVDFLSTMPKVKLTDGEQKRLLDYLDNPNPATHLVFVMPHDQIDKRRKLSKTFLKQTFFVNCSPLDEGQVTRYVEQYLQGSHLDISRDAVNELLGRVNFQMSMAIAEIEKLKQYAQSGSKITVEVVRQLVSRSLESDVFELTNAIMRRNIQAAVQIYQDLILMKHEPIQLHALIVSQFRLLIQVKLLQAQGLMQNDIAKSLGVHPYRVKLALQSSRRFELSRLAALYAQLIEADFQMKTGEGQKETAFYLILTRIMQL